MRIIDADALIQEICMNYGIDNQNLKEILRYIVNAKSLKYVPIRAYRGRNQHKWIRVQNDVDMETQLYREFKAFFQRNPK